jgi:hypothetical protein
MKSGGEPGMAKDVWDNILNQIQTISQPIYATVNPPSQPIFIDWYFAFYLKVTDEKHLDALMHSFRKLMTSVMS